LARCIFPRYRSRRNRSALLLRRRCTIQLLLCRALALHHTFLKLICSGARARLRQSCCPCVLLCCCGARLCLSCANLFLLQLCFQGRDTRRCRCRRYRHLLSLLRLVM